MAKYSIVSLNSIASGGNRIFVDADVQLDLDANRLYDYVHLLALEQHMNAQDVLSGDALLEQRAGKYYDSDYISKEFDLEGFSQEEYQASCQLCALAREDDDLGIVLNEQQSIYVEGKSRKAQYIRLYLSCCTESEREKLKRFLKDSVQNSKIYEAELEQVGQEQNELASRGGSAVIRPLYEMDDLHVKSRSAIVNARVWDFDSASSRFRSEDMYLPGSARIKQFSQVGCNAYLFTDGTQDGCDRLFSSLNQDRGEGGQCSLYSMELKHEGLRMHLNPSFQSLSGMLEQATGEQAESYRQALNIYQTKAALSAFGRNSTDDFFEPAVRVDGMEFNYVAAAPCGGVVTEYQNGNVYSDIYYGKNMYDPVYDIDMPSHGEMRKCRQYAGVFECGGQLYLKYYDSLDYKGSGQAQTDLSALGRTDRKKFEPRRRGWPYQKIETFSPVGRTSGSKHKSLFFSVNIKDDFELYDVQKDDVAERALRNLKFDITQSVKEIVDNVCPANTQLFDVYFGYARG